jgi:hypothetical protein
LVIGSFTDFCDSSAVKPPPCAMKPGITRWNTVPLYWPART